LNIGMTSLGVDYKLCPGREPPSMSFQFLSKTGGAEHLQRFPIFPFV
jgi:hypothetical protein